MISNTDIEDMTDAQDEALKPCPFCGGKAEVIHIGNGPNEGGSCVSCSNCLASSNLEFGFKENFRNNWNRRADLARPSQAGDERVAREAGRAEGWAEAARFLETLKGADLDGNEFDLPVDEWRVAVLMGVRACADKLAALAAMDTPKGGGDEG